MVLWGMAVCVVTVLAVLRSAPALAATRFVATTGTDAANNCLSSVSPCRTNTRALTQAVAGDVIQVAAGTYNTALGETFPLSVGVNLTITGASAVTTIVNAGGVNRVFDITAGSVGISGITITGGANVTQGAGIRNGASANLTVTDVTVDANTASAVAAGGSPATARGGGIYNFGSLTLTRVALTNNRVTATTTGGGAATAQGLDIYNGGGGSMTLTNVTLDLGRERRVPRVRRVRRPHKGSSRRAAGARTRC